MNQAIAFAMYLTGHDYETVKQMYEDWVKSQRTLDKLKDIK